MGPTTGMSKLIGTGEPPLGQRLIIWGVWIENAALLLFRLRGKDTNEITRPRRHRRTLRIVCPIRQGGRRSGLHLPKHLGDRREVGDTRLFARMLLNEPQVPQMVVGLPRAMLTEDFLH